MDKIKFTRATLDQYFINTDVVDEILNLHDIEFENVHTATSETKTTRHDLPPGERFLRRLRDLKCNPVKKRVTVLNVVYHDGRGFEWCVRDDGDGNFEPVSLVEYIDEEQRRKWKQLNNTS